MTATEDTRLFDEAGQAIRPAGATDRPADARRDTGRWNASAESGEAVTVALDNREAALTPTGPAHYPARPKRVIGGYADGGPVPKPALFATVEPVRGLLVARDRTCAVVTPLVAREPDKDTYSRTSTGRVLGEIDEQLVEAAWADNARLRKERDAALGQLDEALGELAAARDRIAQLVLTLRALGGAIHHANQHAAKQADAESGEGGGESDG